MILALIGIIISLLGFILFLKNLQFDSEDEKIALLAGVITGLGLYLTILGIF